MIRKRNARAEIGNAFHSGALRQLALVYACVHMYERAHTHIIELTYVNLAPEKHFEEKNFSYFFNFNCSLINLYYLSFRLYLKGGGEIRRIKKACL